MSQSDLHRFKTVLESDPDRKGGLGFPARDRRHLRRRQRRNTQRHKNGHENDYDSHINAHDSHMNANDSRRRIGY